MRLFNLIAFAAACLCSTSVLQAQITIQQPVVRTLGVGTSVSVPDRGRMFLGGVNSAESFRQSYGPFRSGTSRGYGLSGGSMSASVYIIDLQAMDEAIVNSMPDSVGMPTIRSRSSEPELDVATREIPSAVEKAVRFEGLARQAESSGRMGVAKLHWQMAAKYGSTLALDKLNPPASDATAKK